ncbi:MAG: hypothetical protein UW24_C0026G0016 [Parcubacteria group bacterium GW2011_GWA2_44_12]|nr:MAG: hypothetical protein UW24_C0026G0016 [Parcubacteria group bacterium GW2011_GWA2_44_12]
MASFKNLFHRFKTDQEVNFTADISPRVVYSAFEPQRMVAQRRAPNVYPQFGKRFTARFFTYFLQHQSTLDPLDRSILNVISINKITVGKYLWWLENTHLLCPVHMNDGGVVNAGVYYRARLHRLNELIEQYGEAVFSEF